MCFSISIKTKTSPIQPPKVIRHDLIENCWINTNTQSKNKINIWNCIWTTSLAYNINVCWVEALTNKKKTQGIRHTQFLYYYYYYLFSTYFFTFLCTISCMPKIKLFEIQLISCLSIVWLWLPLLRFGLGICIKKCCSINVFTVSLIFEFHFFCLLHIFFIKVFDFRSGKLLLTAK